MADVVTLSSGRAGGRTQAMRRAFADAVALGESAMVVGRDGVTAHKPEGRPLPELQRRLLAILAARGTLSTYLLVEIMAIRHERERFRVVARALADMRRRGALVNMRETEPVRVYWTLADGHR